LIVAAVLGLVGISALAVFVTDGDRRIGAISDEIPTVSFWTPQGRWAERREAGISSSRSASAWLEAIPTRKAATTTAKSGRRDIVGLPSVSSSSPV